MSDEMWDKLIAEIENMSDEEFFRLVKECEEKPEFNFAIVNNQLIGFPVTTDDFEDIWKCSVMNTKNKHLKG